MDVTIITTLIKEAGLYAGGLFLLGFYISKLVENQRKDNKDYLEIIRDDAKEDKDNLRTELKHNREVNKSMLESNKELTQTNRSLVDKFEGRMENIEGTLTKIDTKIDKIYKDKSND